MSFTKRIATLIIAALMLLSVVSCKKQEPPTNTDITDLSCDEIIDIVYENCGKLDFIDNLKANDNSLETRDIPRDGEGVYYGCSYYFGANLDFIAAAASEPIMQPPAYSFCIAIMPEDCDMEAAAKSVEKNANPDKWVCTGVSTVYVETRGNILALIMADKITADAIKAAFCALDINVGDNSPATTDADETKDLNDDGTIDKATEELFEIVGNLYTAAKDSFAAKDFYSEENKDNQVMSLGKITEKSSANFFGTTIDFEAAVYSEYNIQPSLYSLCLLKVKQDADIEAVKKAVRDNANPNKWICVTAEKVIVESNGEYVMLIMANNAEAEVTKTAFMSLDLK